MPVQVTAFRSRISTVLAVTLPSSGKASVRLRRMVKPRTDSSNQGRYCLIWSLQALQLLHGWLQLRPLRLQLPELALLEEEQPPATSATAAAAEIDRAEPAGGIAGRDLLQGRNLGQQELKQRAPPGQPPGGQAEGRRHGGVRRKLDAEFIGGIPCLRPRPSGPSHPAAVPFHPPTAGPGRAGRRPGSAARSRAVPPAIGPG